VILLEDLILDLFPRSSLSSFRRGKSDVGRVHSLSETLSLSLSLFPRPAR
jgi:hypothetical protein